MSNNTEVKANMAWSTILTIVFVVLKLTDVIDWSWWWVLSPVIIHTLIILTLFGAVYWWVKRKSKS